MRIFYSYISEGNHKSIMQTLLPKYTLEFQSKINKLRRWQDAQLSLLGRKLLLDGLRTYNIIGQESDIKFTAHNKPFMSGQTVKFNISHSGEMVVCALTENAEVGIDIEKIHWVSLEDFKPQMTKNEWNHIRNSKNQLHSFFDYWTQKEAVIKANGQGMSIPLDSFEIKNGKSLIENSLFFVKKVELAPDYKCHIATNKAVNLNHLNVYQISFP